MSNKRAEQLGVWSSEVDAIAVYDIFFLIRPTVTKFKKNTTTDFSNIDKQLEY